jgi:hypothetical protein
MGRTYQWDARISARDCSSIGWPKAGILDILRLGPRSAGNQASKFFTTEKQGGMEITEKPGSWRVEREHLIKHRAKCHSCLLRDLPASLLLLRK